MPLFGQLYRVTFNPSTAVSAVFVYAHQTKAALPLRFSLCRRVEVAQTRNSAAGKANEAARQYHH